MILLCFFTTIDTNQLAEGWCKVQAPRLHIVNGVWPIGNWGLFWPKNPDSYLNHGGAGREWMCGPWVACFGLKTLILSWTELNHPNSVRFGR